MTPNFQKYSGLHEDDNLTSALFTLFVDDLKLRWKIGWQTISISELQGFYESFENTFTQKKDKITDQIKCSQIK